MRTLSRLGTATASAALLLAASAAPALATGDQHEVGLHQPTPISADDPEFAHDTCPGVPAGSDGWHFVLPGNSTTFVELRVSFSPGGEQLVTSFGPPSDKHAYVASEPGAELVAASATVEGEPVNFRLSHTCPASEVPTPEEPGEETPEEPGEETPEEPGEETPEEPGEETPEEPGGAAGGSESEAPAVPEDGQGDDTDLADTGSSTPVLPMTIGAVALLGLGGFLALRAHRSRSRA
ncbi:LPXTG cell wall anchor domain-containing protein [Streptomyces sp. 4N509B]|uniref:LPXTG cell wall anchor domain-containing protein n=1 Tax=Streptomyces sp. 4N509B TaxID=3457413 RepID=UPI003FD0CB26